MPTAEQFEEAKVRFFVSADEAEELIRQTRKATGPDVLKGGKLTEDVNGFIDATGVRLDSIAESLRDLARECRERAQECREAAAAQAAFAAATVDHKAVLLEHETRSTNYAADPAAGDPGPVPAGPTAPPNPPPYVTI